MRFLVRIFFSGIVLSTLMFCAEPSFAFDEGIEGFSAEEARAVNKIIIQVELSAQQFLKVKKEYVAQFFALTYDCSSLVSAKLMNRSECTDLISKNPFPQKNRISLKSCRDVKSNLKRTQQSLEQRRAILDSKPKIIEFSEPDEIRSFESPKVFVDKYITSLDYQLEKDLGIFQTIAQQFQGYCKIRLQ